MIDRDKQIDYWIRGSNSGIETAELLFKGRKLIEGLFFCHLTIEKLIKALIVKNTGELAPKSHNLVYLAELAGTILSAEQNQFMSILMKYQLEGRYPEFHPKKPPKAKIDEYFRNTKSLIQCLRQML
jgi:HEPN domain-containing protein